MPHTSSRIAIASLAFCLAAFQGAAQTTKPGQEAPAQQPPIRTGVNVVRVDVYPTKDGQPVLDLAATDFEILEDGTPQRVDSFEHVLVKPAGPLDRRSEPNSQRQSLQEAANPRNRVFVIFLDTPNVMVDSAHRINEPLIRLVDRILGPDDLIGVMTPAMAAQHITLGRKSEVIEESLRRNWAWGTRFSVMLDEREQQYVACYPANIYGNLAAEMIARRRERMTLEALQDLVRYLYGIREERKAILTVTEGWLLLRENKEMLTLHSKYEPIPGREPITVGPTGQPTTKDPREKGFLTVPECDTDRFRLAQMDNERFFRDIMQEANRANASFYPVDPRGLAVFDTPINAGLPLLVDRAHLKTRQEGMHELAINTDGIAVMDSNDLDAGLKRISDDLSSYYLLGYSSTNTKLDGSLRHLRVRVKRPGVEVRARRSYRAATMDEAANARRAAEPPSPSTVALTTAMSSLARIRPNAPFRINASALVSSGTVWVAGELVAGRGGEDAGAAGGTADIEASAGTASVTSRVTLKPGERRFLATLKMPGLAPGDLNVRARFTGETGMGATDAVRVTVDAATAQPLLFRRGPTTANRVVPAADFEFSRTERIRVEIPVAAGATPTSAKLLDKAAGALDVPVTVSGRQDDAGQAWIVADLSLAPLGPSDYVIEIVFASGGVEQRVLTAIRVTR